MIFVERNEDFSKQAIHGGILKHDNSCNSDKNVKSLEQKSSTNRMTNVMNVVRRHENNSNNFCQKTLSSTCVHILELMTIMISQVHILLCS